MNINAFELLVSEAVSACPQGTIAPRTAVIRAFASIVSKDPQGLGQLIEALATGKEGARPPRAEYLADLGATLMNAARSAQAARLPLLSQVAPEIFGVGSHLKSAGSGNATARGHSAISELAMDIFKATQTAIA